MGYQEKVAEFDREIEKLLQSFTANIDTDKAKLVRCDKTICKKNAVAFDVGAYGYSVWGVNTMAIAGMSAKWCNLVPNNKISGGKLIYV